MEISKKHPPFLHYLKEMSAKMADSLLMTASGALPEELFKYFVDGIHLLKGVLLATAAHMVKRSFSMAEAIFRKNWQNLTIFSAITARTK